MGLRCDFCNPDSSTVDDLCNGANCTDSLLFGTDTKRYECTGRFVCVMCARVCV